MGIGLRHEFLLVHKDEISANSKNFFKHQKFLLHDDIVSVVMSGFLKWIPTFNPSVNESGFGLNAYGITVIKKDGAEKAKAIFRAWRDLILAAPDQVIFNCGFQYQDDEAIPFRPEFSRAELLDNFNGILAELDRVGDEYCLLHLGI